MASIYAPLADMQMVLACLSNMSLFLGGGFSKLPTVTVYPSQWLHCDGSVGYVLKQVKINVTISGVTSNSSVDAIGERYLMNHAVALKLYHACILSFSVTFVYLTGK